MKKFVCTALAVVLLLMSVSAFAEGGQETALETGDRDIAFSNGFHGFCLDVNLKASYTGDVFF